MQSNIPELFVFFREYKGGFWSHEGRPRRSSPSGKNPNSATFNNNNNTFFYLQPEYKYFRIFTYYFDFLIFFIFSKAFHFKAQTSLSIYVTRADILLLCSKLPVVDLVLQSSHLVFCFSASFSVNDVNFGCIPCRLIFRIIFSDKCSYYIYSVKIGLWEFDLFYVTKKKINQ